MQTWILPCQNLVQFLFIMVCGVFCGRKHKCWPAFGMKASKGGFCVIWQKYGSQAFSVRHSQWSPTKGPTASPTGKDKGWERWLLVKLCLYLFSHQPSKLSLLLRYVFHSFRFSLTLRVQVVLLLMVYVLSESRATLHILQWAKKYYHHRLFFSLSPLLSQSRFVGQRNINFPTLSLNLPTM